MRAAEIRQQFIDYFKSNGHEHVESSTLVPQNDPTLLFSNAGMNQFKDVFLGKEQRPYSRAVTAQKCVRAGGKHNDLENVGYTARHHTFFEMLGNFSFGDYFKKEAIHHAWHFSTKILKLPLDRLYVTVYEDDDEAAEIWRQQEQVPPERILRMGAKDNFWSMGDTGPCGPCTELFMDRGAAYGCGQSDCAVGCECDRFVEFWNLVFMQFDRDQSGDLTPLPKPSVDTGAGLERLAMIMQDAPTNYDSDVFTAIIRRTEQLCQKSYHPEKDSGERVAFRVIADHARAAAFLIGDGVMPSNEGRGYVLRRIIRRAVRYGRSLEMSGAFLAEVCEAVIQEMGSIYPELVERQLLISRCVRAEEEQFLRTLERGLDLLDAELAKIKKGQSLDGEMAFKLYDTFGFPLDLTALIAKEHGTSVDEAGFESCMQKQKSRSRQNWKGGDGKVGIDEVYHRIAQQLSEQGVQQSFVGYELYSSVSRCLAIINHQGDQAELLSSSQGPELELIFEVTPFYGESGGQVGDHGWVRGHGFSAQVIEATKPLAQWIAVKVMVQEGQIEIGQSYEQIVDDRRRTLVRRNHTATHLLHDALRRVLGEHVKQAGSLVTDELLRFDFNHFQAVTSEQLNEIEDLVNQQIWYGRPVAIQEMSKDEAVAAGAIAFFGEKYGETVRVVSAGQHSVELCGGTHVDNTAEIQLFRIVSEGAVAAGVRRIVAYTSEGAFNYLKSRDQESKLVRDYLKAHTCDEVMGRLEKFSVQEKSLRKQLEEFESKAAAGQIDQWLQDAERLGEAKLILRQVEPHASGIKYLRDLADVIRNKDLTAVCILFMSAPEEGKVFCLAAKHPKSHPQFNANQLIQKVAPLIDARGGGKPDMAQAGGTNLGGVKEAIEQAQAAATAVLKL